MNEYGRIRPARVLAANALCHIGDLQPDGQKFPR